MDTRRRAQVACQHCRQRKRRCDALSPACSSCLRRGITCTYADDTANTSRSSGRVAVLENLLRSQHAMIRDLQESLASRPSSLLGSAFHRSDKESETAERSVPIDLTARASTTQSESPAVRTILNVHDLQSALLTIPLGHETNSASLLRLKEVRELAGVFPEEFFFRIESRRPQYFSSSSNMSLAPTPWDRLSFAEGTRLIDVYFTHVHPFFPILDRNVITNLFESAFGQDLTMDKHWALLSTLLALGRVVEEPPYQEQPLAGDSLGGDFAQLGMRTLTAMWCSEFEGDLVLSQGLLLCAVYFTYVVRPLQAWKLVHMASTTIQQFLRNGQDDPEKRAGIGHICWACFIVECDILAEFHQPRSGIEAVIDGMPFPSTDGLIERSHFSFLAEASMRSLHNRIHHTLHFYRLSDRPHSFEASAPSDETLKSLSEVCQELARQVQSWYDALPNTIAADLLQENCEDLQLCLIQARYWSAMYITFKPFVLHMTSGVPGREVPSFVMDHCRSCLSSCRNFLRTTSFLMAKRTPYAYSAAQSCLSASLLLAIAAFCPAVSGMVPDATNLQDTALERLRPWTGDNTAIDAGVDIITVVRSKLRYRN